MPETSGGGSRIRTYDLLIKSQLLYQLSYTPENRRDRKPTCRTCEFGRPCGIRTCDQRIKSPLLYQLS